jgi:hypothetical protein
MKTRNEKIKYLFRLLRCDLFFYKWMLFPVYLSMYTRFVRKKIPIIKNKTKLYDIAISTLLVFNYYEFGVGAGNNIKHFNVIGSGNLYGFDCFNGLPERWGNLSAGTYKFNKPDIQGVKIIEGLFVNTLDKVRYESPMIINIDSDLYSSAMQVLCYISKYLHTNDLIIFDEFNVPMSEFKAYLDWCKIYNIPHKIVAGTNNLKQILIKII